ncbi:MAG: cupin domain-containing protein [Chloroflexi bacterium]|nr:cupin domain-containing protein [Chloroflexota bacterium]
MSAPYTYLADVVAAVEIPADGTLSRTIYSDAAIKVVLFGFDAGQELSEHTSSRPATIQIVRGEARLTLGGDTFDAHPGAWIHMPAGLPHTVCAVTPLTMLLVLLPLETGEVPTT